MDEVQKRKTDIATTLIICSLNEKTVESTIAHIGDSRAYVIDDSIWRTKDHSLVQDLVDIGVLNDKLAFFHPEKHRLKQTLGMKN